MFILGRAHQSHPSKHVLGSAVGGGWPLSQAQHWVANKSSAEPGSPSAGRQTPEGGRPWPGLTRPGPVRLARPAATTLTNTPLGTTVAGLRGKFVNMNSGCFLLCVCLLYIEIGHGCMYKFDWIAQNQYH
jgi:hypothetical protein